MKKDNKNNYYNSEDQINFEKLENFIHLLYVFLVIRPLRSIIGIFLLNKLTIVFGQISESIKKAFDGFQ